MSSVAPGPSRRVSFSTAEPSTPRAFRTRQRLSRSPYVFRPDDDSPSSSSPSLSSDEGGPNSPFVKNDGIEREDLIIVNSPVVPPKLRVSDARAPLVEPRSPSGQVTAGVARRAVLSPMSKKATLAGRTPKTVEPARAHLPSPLAARPAIRMEASSTPVSKLTGARHVSPASEDSTPPQAAIRRLDFSSMPRFAYTPSRPFVPTPIRSTRRSLATTRSPSPTSQENFGDGDDLGLELSALRISEPVLRAPVSSPVSGEVAIAGDRSTVVSMPASTAAAVLTPAAVELDRKMAAARQSEADDDKEEGDTSAEYGDARDVFDDAVLSFSPGPSSPPAVRETSREVEAIVIISSDESDSGDAVARRKKAPRRVVESDDDEAPLPQPRTRRVLVTDDEEEHAAGPADFDRMLAASPSPPRTGPPHRKPRALPAALRFLDLSADEDQSEDEAEADDSYGSLDDFIVDDEDDDGGSSSSSAEDWAAPRARPRLLDPAVVYELDSSDDDTDDDGILRYSPPRRPVALPDLSALTLDTDADSPAPTRPCARPARRQPSPASAKTAKTRKAWEADRARIANALFAELDEKVFERKLGKLGAGAHIEWSKRLLTTAGTATRSRTRGPEGEVVERVKITLSDKVCTDQEAILSTVAHEMCHLAAWMISNERSNPHGKVFKSWGRKVMRVRKDIEVTTRHNYEIEYKYQWKCTDERCGKIYSRHSKSIDVTRQACGACRGRLAALFATKTSAFQTYLKTCMKDAKAALPGQPHGDVMRALSKRWAEQGEPGEHAAYWAAQASRARA
ncbi:hypothetical protein Q5752_002978 [Cryptotrichosporon argae]